MHINLQPASTTPYQLTGLIVTSIFGGAALYWDHSELYQTNRYEIWHNKADNIDTAELLVLSETNHCTIGNLSMSQDHWFWVRVKNQHDIIGPFTPAVKLIFSSEVVKLLQLLSDDK